MQRKKFLKYLAGGIAVAFTGIAVTPGFNQVLQKMIEEDTATLPLEEGCVQKYLSVAEERQAWSVFSPSKQQFIRAHYLLSNALFKLPYHHKYLDYRSQVVGNFLLSTSFFMNKMDMHKKISFTGLYDPYLKPCSNPFSNLYYQLPT